MAGMESPATSGCEHLDGPEQRNLAGLFLFNGRVNMWCPKTCPGTWDQNTPQLGFSQMKQHLVNEKWVLEINTGIGETSLI